MRRGTRAGLEAEVRSPARRSHWIIAAAIVTGACSTGDQAAHAQVRVEGRPDAVHVEVRDVPLREVLEALAIKYNLRYRANDPLDMPVTGTFDGSLHRVAVRVLDGYDFAMKLTPEAIDVLILRRDRPAVVAVAVRAQVRPRAPAMTAQEANRRERGLLR